MSIKVLFIVRSTLFTVKGGDTIQVIETAAHLRQLFVEVTIKETQEIIDYSSYDLLHFFNITRPADILVHAERSGKPFVVSPILVDYAQYDKQHRPGFAGKLFRWLSPPAIEYVKTIYRAARRKDMLVSTSYLWKGQRRSIKKILAQSSCVLVSATAEYRQLENEYSISPYFMLAPNGINTNLFKPVAGLAKEECLVLCVARVEGIKNQYNLIRALNNTRYRLILIGDAAPNQQGYYAACKKIAADNISFIGHLPQQQLLQYYAKAKVHVLPSWFEVCGLSSLEAAAMGCNVVITDNGYARSYFNEEACYCNPEDPSSILAAVEKAACSSANAALQQRMQEQYNWEQTAAKILSVYQKCIV